jgi:hypothetical protein
MKSARKPSSFIGTMKFTDTTALSIASQRMPIEKS